MRKRRRKQLLALCGVLGAALLVFVCVILGTGKGAKEENPRYIEPTQQTVSVQPETAETETEAFSYEAVETAETASFPDSVISTQGILINVDNGTILAKKDAFDRMVPASMTKILTVLVAAEHITEEQLDETVTISIEATDYSYSHDCSNTGYEVDEQVTVRDLFYGTILPSGADSAYSLATYVAGSHEAFVAMMNEKLAEMGLSETTHFTNCVGLYDEEHYSTPYDMAMILKAAMDNTLCREVLGTRVYTTTLTTQHPEGLTISNWFLRRIEDKDTHGEVIGAKTGFVSQSGSCAASMAVDTNGTEYICVTAGSTSSWRCIYDHVDIYDAFLPEAAEPETVTEITE